MLSDDRISQFMESANPIIPVEAYTTFKEEMAQIIPQSLKEHCEMMWASCIAIERMTCVAIFTAQALPLNLSNTLLNIMFERWQLRQKYRSLVSFSNVAPYRAVPFQDNKEMDHEPIEVDMIITPYGSECFEFSIDDMVRSSGSLFHLFRRITDLYGDGKGEASVFEDLYRKTKVEVEQQIDKIGAHFLWAIKNRKQVPMSHIGQIWFRSYDYLPGGFSYLTDWLIESDDTSFRRRMGQMEGGLAIARRMSFEGGANIDRLVAFERCLEGIEEKRDRFVMLKNLLLQQNLQNLQNLQTVACVVPVATVSAIPEGNIFSPDPDIFSAFPSVF
ncbi:hypothetical protein BT69DRAFT_668954 [Atractiella rhizophila]|nr:hypothetical protein BT69DRAFT_668954 [Atractiella rhizophila]